MGCSINNSWKHSSQYSFMSNKDISSTLTKDANRLHIQTDIADWQKSKCKLVSLYLQTTGSQQNGHILKATLCVHLWKLTSDTFSMTCKAFYDEAMFFASTKLSKKESRIEAALSMRMTFLQSQT